VAAGQFFIVALKLTPDGWPNRAEFALK